MKTVNKDKALSSTIEMSDGPEPQYSYYQNLVPLYYYPLEVIVDKPANKLHICYEPNSQLLLKAEP